MFGNIFAVNKSGSITLHKEPRKVTNVGVFLQGDVQGLPFWSFLRFHTTKPGRDGLLQLDANSNVAVVESFVDGRETNAQSGCTVACPGPKEAGRFLKPDEQMARVDLPRILGDRPRFLLKTQAEVAKELSTRILVDTEEVSFFEPEELLFNEESRLQRGDFSLMPHIIKGADGDKVRLRATVPGVVTKVTSGSITIKCDDKRTRDMLLPEGLAPAKYIRPGRRVGKGQSLVRLATSVDGLSTMDLGGHIVDALRSLMFVQDKGRNLLRLPYATAVAHHCLRCGHNNGVHTNARFVCSCGKSMSVEGPIAPDAILTCHCGNAGPSEVFRKHRVCSKCGGAAVPSIKKAYALCNGRHYEIPEHAAGGVIPKLSELSYVRGFFRGLKEQGVRPEDLVLAATWRPKYPRTVLVA